MQQPDPSEYLRYDRQMIYAPLGLAGQRALREARALIVGVGGLGSWVAELLARAGVGLLRLVDDDRVHVSNLHRQALYDEADATAGAPKVRAAAERLSRLNRHARIEPVEARLDWSNAAALADGADLILDGTDNFATRFVLNDLSVKRGVPWIFAGVVGAEAQTAVVRPRRSACLRCVFDGPPPACSDPSCRQAGVLGPAVAAVAAMQAAEALKLLSGHAEAASPYLTKLDLWGNLLQRIDVSRPHADCPCCAGGVYEFLEP